MTTKQHAQRYRTLLNSAVAVAIVAVFTWIAVPTATASQHKKMDVEKYVEHLDTQLSLTAEQKQKITALLQEKQAEAQNKREEVEKQREQRKEEREKMKEQRKQQREERKKERMAAQEEFRNQIASLLTPEQRAKFEQMKEERKNKMKEKSKGKRKGKETHNSDE